MLSVEEARKTILDAVRPLGSEMVFLGNAGGRILADTYRAQRSLPPADNSAMDGYAVYAADLEGASEDTPVRIEVVGSQLAGGDDVGAVPAGKVVRIMTGAPMPEGPDSVVIRENTDESEVGDDDRGTVAIRSAPKVGANVRRRGEDVQEGDVVGAPGDELTPGRINLIASAGYATVAVHRRPTVAIVASGDELKQLGEPLGPRDIVNSNAWAIANAVRGMGAEARLMGIAADTLEDHQRMIEAAGDADVLVTIGGVSMGTHDFVRPALEAAGAELSFWKVAMRPGKPLAFGKRGEQLVFGLPGNPVSSVVGFQMWLRPTLRKLQGRKKLLQRLPRARVVGEGFSKKPTFVFFARARAELGDEGWTVEIERKQSSGQISALAWANALAVLPVGVESVSEGDEIAVMLLNDEALHTG
jgi:molybdopterin molybdotransferase